MGALLVSGRSRNPIGWTFLGIGIFTGFPGVATQYVFRSWHFHRLPAAAWVAWTHDWIVWLVFPTGLAAFLFLLFPDGCFQSPPWRRLGWVAGFLLVAGVAASMLETLYPAHRVAGHAESTRGRGGHERSPVSALVSLASLPHQKAIPLARHRSERRDG